MPVAEQMLRYAAPTLAGCKVANLMSVPCCLCQQKDFAYCQNCLACSGISIHLLSDHDDRRLLYIYRRSALLKLLSDPEIQSFLRDFSYKDFSIAACLGLLTKHVGEEKPFPHEIGIFLGYPLKDVSGFIANKGKNAKLTGYWKVYDNEEEAVRTFALYADCRRDLWEKFRQGFSFRELSVVG